MSDNTNNEDDKRTNLAPILAPIITLFIGFGAGVVFSDLIPMGKSPVIHPVQDPVTGKVSHERGRDAEEVDVDAQMHQALEDAAAQGDEEAKRLLEEEKEKARDAVPTDTPPTDTPGG